jgi:hypothetical protein
MNIPDKARLAVQRPGKRLLKANESKRTAFVAHYADLRAEAQEGGTKHFFFPVVAVHPGVLQAQHLVMTWRCTDALTGAAMSVRRC